MGGTLGTIFARAGHDVVFSYSRSEGKLRRLARRSAGARACRHAARALDVDEPMMEGVHLRHEERQRAEVRVLGGKQLAGAGVEMALVGGVHLVAKGARLGIEIGEVGKAAAGQEIVLDEMKGPLDAGRAVGIALFIVATDELVVQTLQ